jgi:outer membrane cobalamin receptor
MRIRLLLVCCAIACWSTPRAMAQQDTLKFSEKISTAEAILTRADFKRLGCENVGDALRNITGVYVRNGQIALRDVAADKVVVLLDGQRLNTAQGGGVDVITLPIDAVETVEVVRGGNSALYGADAVGGVVKITTRGRSTEHASVVNVNAHSTIASFHTSVNAVELSHRLDEFNYLISYKRTTSRGNFQYIDPSTNKEMAWMNNDQAINDLFLKTGYVFDTSSTVSLSGGWYDAALGAPGIIEQLTPDARLGYSNRNVNINYERANLFGDFKLKAQMYLLYFKLHYQNPTGFVPQNSTHNNDATAFDLQQSGTIGAHVELSYGYNFRQDRLNSTDIGRKQRNNHAAFGVATVAFRAMDFFFDELDVTPALRYDYPTDFSPVVSPKVTLMLKHRGTPEVSIISHLTRSYRAPTFDDLYWPKDSYSEGNPNLVPEEGVNYDVGIELHYPVFGEFTLTTNYFVNNLDNLILWAPGADNLWRPSNISKSQTNGVEAAIRLKPVGEFLELGVDYTYMTALDKSDNRVTQDKDLIYRPRNKLDATVTFRYIGIEVNFLGHYVGKRYTTASNTQWLDPYRIAEANIGYSFKAWDVNWSAKFEVNNLTDLHYFPIDKTPVPGRELRFSLGVSI